MLCATSGNREEARSFMFDAGDGWTLTTCFHSLARLASASWSSLASPFPPCLILPSKTYCGWLSNLVFCPRLHWCRWLALRWGTSCPPCADSVHSKWKHTGYIFSVFEFANAPSVAVSHTFQDQGSASNCTSLVDTSQLNICLAFFSLKFMHFSLSN